MAFLDFTDDYKINLEEIDEQHENLFNMLNRLHQSVVDGAERSELDEILGDLIDYTVVHFGTEEELFEAHDYPDVDAHKREHDKLTKQALELQAKFREGSATISFEVLEFLSDWLKEHTMGSDQKFAAFVNAE